MILVQKFQMVFLIFITITTWSLRSFVTLSTNTLSNTPSFYFSGSGVNLLLITPEKVIKLVGNDFFRHILKTEK